MPASRPNRNVTFYYGNDTSKRDLLTGVNLKISSGQNVAIVGPSGSGKSTTLRLISRMLDPVSGQIFLDGIDTRTVSLESLRGRISVVPQDTSLFDETVEYNLIYGNISATSADIASALDKCNLVETIEKLPKGLQTSVGERGARLSGGERQKVSIARALLKNPTLILCDEVTSSVDAFAERDIVDTLRRASEQRTTLTVAHRLSSIVHCDVIIVMDRGKVVEQGSHQQLMKSEGVYAKMWDAQNGEALNSGIDDPSSSEVLKTSTGGFMNTPVPLSGESLLWTATSESLASLVISGGGKGLARGTMEPLMMMRSTAREDRLGFISDLESSHNHGNRAKSVLDGSKDETVSKPDEIIALGDLGPNPESVKNDDKSLI